MGVCVEALLCSQLANELQVACKQQHYHAVVLLLSGGNVVDKGDVVK